jgi:uncharacterized surface protein with fasciclin (FAS1) repeats
MSVTRRWLTWTGSCAAALAFLLVAGTAISQQEQQRQQQQQQQAERNIPDTLREKGNFTKLQELLREADLEETLTQRGPFTLLAPTDEALSQIPQEQLNQLKQNKEQLKALLQRHVLRGEMTAADLARTNRINPLEGAAIQVRSVGGQQTGQAARDRESVQARAQQSLDRAREQGREISQAARERETPVRAGERLSQIAPDDQVVIMVIPKNDPTNVRSAQFTGEQVRNFSEELIAKLREAKAIQSEEVAVRDDQAPQIMIGSARVVEPNIRATNGIIHAIDKVLNQQNAPAQQ